MLWLMTMGRRLNGVYAAFMLVAFMMGVAGADVEFVSQPRSGGATILGGPVLYRKRHRRDPG